MPVTDVVAASAAAELATYLDRGQVLVGGAGYEAARAVWNGAVDRHPAVIVRPWTRGDVQATIRTAREHQLPLSVRGGGYDWTGRSVRADGLELDLSRMRRVTVDPATRIATVAGGATVADVVAAAAPYGLAAVTGTIGGLGMAGLTLAGGYGPLAGRFGLAADNLLGADVVMEDGRLVRADPAHEPELYWALRGGGGNFGVVTAMSVRLHPLAQVLAGLILFPWRDAADVWDRLGTMLANAPAELDVQSGVLSGKDGRPVLYLMPTWSGESAHGEKIFADLRRLGSPVVCRIRPTDPAGLLTPVGSHAASGRHYAIRTRNLPGLTPDVILALMRAGGTRTSPLSSISLRHFHGRPARVPVPATAFGTRQEHFLAEVTASWLPGDRDGALHRTWADSAATALVPSALSGAYPGLLGPDDHYQITHAYGANTARLLTAKEHYDPDGIFTATPLPITQHARSWITA
ncbi:MAG TPA: FAD-binding oxidoreductase [Trebonia sp.]|nr:FAD-binding oxidoreductase [Trebonia sp.]